MSKEITEEELEEEKRAYHDHKEHEMNMKSLAKGFKRLARMADNKDKKRANSDGETVLSLNVGAFIRKATNNGADKTMSTYWTYKGSLTTPGKYIKVDERSVKQIIYVKSETFNFFYLKMMFIHFTVSLPRSCNLGGV